MDRTLHYEYFFKSICLDYAVNLIFVIVAIGVKVGGKCNFFHKYG